MDSALSAALVAAASLWTAPVVSLAQDAASQQITEWVAVPGARFETEADGVIVVRRGIIRSRRVFSDFVLRFEFRLADSSSEGALMVRSRFGYGGSRSSQRGYRVSAPGVEKPKPIKEAKPFYPHEPHDTRVQGTVPLEIVVDAAGKVGDVRVTKELSFRRSQ